MNKPLMPKATAVWLIENTMLTFKQISDFCNLHELEVKGIADGDVAKGIKAYNPILAGQLTREEIEASSNDGNRPLRLNKKTIDIRSKEKKKHPLPIQFRRNNIKERRNNKTKEIDYVTYQVKFDDGEVINQILPFYIQKVFIP